MRELLDTIAVISFLLIPILLVVAVILLIRKKPAKKWFIATVTSAILWLVCILIPICDHEWIEATCTAPKTCSLCNKTEGNVLEHNWVEATCVTSKNCTLCGLTEGEALGHTPGDWKLSGTNFVSATVTSKKYCSVCEDEVDRQTVSLKALHDGEKFLMSPKDFVERLQDKLNGISGNNVNVITGSIDDNSLVCGFSVDNKKVGAFLFIDGENTITTSQKYDSCFNKLLGTVDDADNFTRVLLALIETCDPTLSFYEAKDIGEDVLVNGEVTKNGITYVCAIASDGAILGVTIEE